MASTLLAHQQRGAGAACAAAPGHRALRCSVSFAPRLSASRPSASALRVFNTASGSRGSPPHQQSQQPQLQRKPVQPAKPGSPLATAARRASAARAVVSSTSDSLSRLLANLAGPTLMAGLAGGLLAAAAALHHGDGGAAAEHASAAASAIAGGSLYPAREFGPADFVDTAFGPTRPVWALLLHSHHYATAAAASSVVKHADVAATAAAAMQHLPHLPLPDLSGAMGAGGGVSPGGSLAAHSTASELWAQARGAAQVAAGHVSDVAHDAVAQTVDGYNAWLEESPLMCKIVTGNFFTVAGDMLAQLGCGGGGHGAPEAADASAAGTAAGGRRRVDWARTARLCTETSLVGTPMAHWWFNLLDARVLPDDPHCPAAVLTKTLLDQLLFAPLGLALFFVVIKLLEGRPADISRSLKTSYVKSLLGGYLLWPVAGLLNFALLPNEYRLLFNNCVNIIWTCFLSIMSSSDDSTERATTAATPAVSAAPVAAMASASPAAAAPAADAPASAAAAASGGFMAGAQDLAAAAVTAAAMGAAVHGNRPAFGAVAGLAVAVVEATCNTAATAVAAAAAASDEQQPLVSQSLTYGNSSVLEARPFAAGGSVLVGGPCLEVCEPERDETSR